MNNVSINKELPSPVLRRYTEPAVSFQVHWAAQKLQGYSSCLEGIAIGAVSYGTEEKKAYNRMYSVVLCPLSSPRHRSRPARRTTSPESYDLRSHQTTCVYLNAFFFKKKTALLWFQDWPRYQRVFDARSGFKALTWGIRALFNSFQEDFLGTLRARLLDALCFKLEPKFNVHSDPWRSCLTFFLHREDICHL